MKKKVLNRMGVFVLACIVILSVLAGCIWQSETEIEGAKGTLKLKKSSCHDGV